jgi:5-methylcytosine-specific restriction endonuclease McrA
LNRQQIFERDEFRCVYCGELFPAEELTVDHVQPLVRGGDNSGGNLVTACKGCNTRKGNRRLHAFLEESGIAREQFLERAKHVWKRLLRD